MWMAVWQLVKCRLLIGEVQTAILQFQSLDSSVYPTLHVEEKRLGTQVINLNMMSHTRDSHLSVLTNSWTTITDSLDPNKFEAGTFLDLSRDWN